MNWLFRPGTLVVLSLALALMAGAALFWPFNGAAANHAVVRPVPTGDQEIAWLNPATSAVTWERFVAAVKRLEKDRPDLGLIVHADANPFPTQTADIPELAISIRSNRQRLWFRWYKLTGDLGHRQWVQAFARRQPAPLAIIGGGSSDRASNLATELSRQQDQFANPPLFLITTASLEQELMAIYPHRTFRFCFTNRQMAEAVTDFLWSQDDLRPDTEPVYLARWEDDPYSGDLSDEFRRVLGPEGKFNQKLQQVQAVREFARHWSWGAGRAGGADTLGLNLEDLLPAHVQPPGPFWTMRIPYSVGSFNRPNQWEEGAAEKLMNEIDQHPEQQRPLLILPSSPLPARRFLRAMMTLAPVEARRFVVATGDAIDFNTVYRDRNIAWPVQDLPVPLIFFCQRNPVDPVAFQPDGSKETTQPPDPSGTNSTGTQDLLLYRDLVETVVEAAFAADGLRQTPEEISQQFREAQLKDRRRRFTTRGNQRSGKGEFVVCLRPVRIGTRVLPQAHLQVWNRSDDPERGRQWVRVPVAGRMELVVDYVPGAGE